MGRMGKDLVAVAGKRRCLWLLWPLDAWGISSKINESRQQSRQQARRLRGGEERVEMREGMAGLGW